MEMLLENKPAVIYGAGRPSAAHLLAPSPARVRRFSLPVGSLHRSTPWLGRSSPHEVVATRHAEVVGGRNYFSR
jgi:hypothetical protein